MESSHRQNEFPWYGVFPSSQWISLSQLQVQFLVEVFFASGGVLPNRCWILMFLMESSPEARAGFSTVDAVADWSGLPQGSLAASAAPAAPASTTETQPPYPCAVWLVQIPTHCIKCSRALAQKRTKGSWRCGKLMVLRRQPSS